MGLASSASGSPAICFHRLAHAAYLGDEPAVRAAAASSLACHPGPVLEFRDEHQADKILAFLALRDGRPAEALAIARRGREPLVPPPRRGVDGERARRAPPP